LPAVSQMCRTKTQRQRKHKIFANGSIAPDLNKSARDEITTLPFWLQQID